MSAIESVVASHSAVAENAITAPAWWRPTYRTVRAGFDRPFAVLLLGLSAPILAAVALAIRLDSPGPILFRQRRIGLRGRPFRILKFRTMKVDAPAFSLKVSEHSPLITRFGRFLRSTGLDEMPQLWNVCRGEMGIIGPRPEQFELADLYDDRVSSVRHAIRPGITGWWQIHHRDGVPLHLNPDRDIYYVQHQSPLLDFLIAAGTAKILMMAVVDGLRAAIAAVAYRA